MYKTFFSLFLFTYSSANFISLEHGSWNKNIAELEVNKDINEYINTEFTYFHEQKEGFVKYNEFKYDYFSSDIDLKLSKKTKIKTHFAYEKEKEKGEYILIPSYYSDGTKINFAKEFNLGSPWTQTFFEETKFETSFEHEFKNKVKLFSIFSYEKVDEPYKSYEVSEANIDKNSGLGAYVSASNYSKIEDIEKDLTLYTQIPFLLFNKKNQITLGFSYNKYKWENRYKEAVNSSISLGDIHNFKGIEEPLWQNNTQKENGVDITKSLFVLNDLELESNINLISGIKNSSFKSADLQSAKNQRITYLGLFYKNDDELDYEVFDYERLNEKLDDDIFFVKARLYELGFKDSYFDKKLNLDVVLFKSLQYDLFLEDELHSKGFDIKLYGKLFKKLDYSLDFSKFQMKTKSGKVFEPLNPREKLSLKLSYPFKNFEFSTDINWQSKIYDYDEDEKLYYKQASYTLVDTSIKYLLNKKHTLGLAVNNIFDESYYEDLNATGAYMKGDPRHFSLSYKYTF